MKILAVAGNGALVKQGGKVEMRPFESFLTAAQKQGLARNQKHEQKVYADLRKRLESKVEK